MPGRPKFQAGPFVVAPLLKRLAAQRLLEPYWLRDDPTNVLLAPMVRFSGDDISAALNHRRDDLLTQPSQLFDTLRLPFPSMLFEVHGEGYRMCVLCFRSLPDQDKPAAPDNRGLGAMLYDLKGDEVKGPAVWAELDCTAGVGDCWTIGDLPKGADFEPYRVEGDIAANVLIGGVLLLSRKGAVSVVKGSVPSAKRTTRRCCGEFGWQYQIVTLNDEHRPKGPHQGGTHAPPRWHLRRGHWRHLATGRQVWIREAQVGERERGAVVHDYDASPGDHA